ncbi:MAG: hypothetical protein LZF86_110801 [Nitrospira sp.]|nr:MAG: hypothetical protein LZF86_110801 [Nitrospira sp.]
MAQVIRSGAFLQQCWSVHPLCVTVKRIADDRTVVLLCSSCRSAHHVHCASVAAQSAAMPNQPDAAVPVVAGEAEALAKLEACIAAHRPALSLREMDVFEDRVLIRCADCRLHYDLSVAQFEMRQK